MHEKFHYKTLDEIKQTAAALGVSLPFAADTHALAESLRVGKHVFPNRLGIAPMEGADSLPDGSPSDFTARRYLREAKGGSAIIWFEAISIVPEGRSSATQLYLCRENLDSYKRLTQAVKEAGLQVNGFAPCRPTTAAGIPTLTTSLLLSLPTAIRNWSSTARRTTAAS